MRILILATLAALVALSTSAQQLSSSVNNNQTGHGVSTTTSLQAKGVTMDPVSVGAVPPVRVTVEVDASKDTAPSGATTTFHATAKDILSSAGTYGDFSRYLQMFPGVAFNNDESDDVLVRGGNPLENLYVVDGIDVPNINHIATQGTTGGLVSMIASTAIEDLDFLTGGYDARYDERLSSVVDIHTREPRGDRRYTEAELGFIGAGVTTETPLGDGGSLLASAHRSLLNLFTNNIGLNGVPIYTNSLTRARLALTPEDTLTILSLGGIDSMNISPVALDGFETNTIDTQYKGWRVTNGLLWQHAHSATNFGTLTISDSEDEENIRQEDQFFDDVLPAGYTAGTLPLTPVYSELTHDGVSDLKYDLQAMYGRRLTLLAGSDARVHRVAYNIAQPEGEQSPLNVNPERSDATSFAPHFWSGETGSYAQGSYQITKRWSGGAGLRGQTFAFGGHATLTPRLNTAYRLTNYLQAHFSFGEYAQLAPYIYLTSWSVNHGLGPIHDRQLVAGIDLFSTSLGKLKLEAYRKDYRNYPVATEYPTLSLADMVDTLGQEFLWIPMVGAGPGRAVGVDLSGESHLGSHLFLLANIALARNQFAGLDGILRPGNFDYPLIANFAGAYHSGRRYEASYRYEYSSGRPYTPFLLSECIAQNRPIYDLSLVNALRGPVYSRLDFSVGRSFVFGPHTLTLYGGLENAWNRENFLEYAWMPRVGASWGECKVNPAACVSEQTQMGRFPNFGARYSF